MTKVYKILILSLAVMIICSNCNQECDDCLELTTKNIRYINSDGTNLLFGNQAIYDPDSVIIKVGNDNNISVWKQEDLGTIMFNLEGNYTSYYIVLSDSVVDTLDFELAQRKSTRCCGNVTYSTKTLLNGHEIEYDDLIVIIR
jgi:hypothetical protein